MILGSFKEGGFTQHHIHDSNKHYCMRIHTLYSYKTHTKAEKKYSTQY
jgi:hypothetical protein